MSGAPRLIEDQPSLRLSNPGKWELQGYSRAGVATGFLLNKKIALDAGMHTRKKPKVVCVTHKHTDHTQCLPTFFAGREGDPKPVFFPKPALVPLRELERSFLLLSRDEEGEAVVHEMCDADIFRKQGVRPLPCEAGEAFDLHPWIPQCHVEILPAFHRATSVGYGFSTERLVLKPEYKEWTQTVEGRQRLKALSAQEKWEPRRTPEVMYFCDSTPEHLATQETWKKYPCIICECTGFPDLHEEAKIREMGHTHLNALLPILLAHPDKQWILIHPSHKCKQEELRQWEERLRKHFELDVTLWREQM
mmetsp:Transcript_43006/g.111154  ORF Transcript_43006/g.111154 Transcript_43006/m.111154 type:complete len:306 (+) Transcript_43006:126-1043(+)